MRSAVESALREPVVPFCAETGKTFLELLSFRLTRRPGFSATWVRLPDRPNAADQRRLAEEFSNVVAVTLYRSAQPQWRSSIPVGFGRHEPNEADFASVTRITFGQLKSRYTCREITVGRS